MLLAMLEAIQDAGEADEKDVRVRGSYSTWYKS